MPKLRIPLDDEELETILAIARNGQSGRITLTEIDELVRAYREMLARTHVADDLPDPFATPLDDPRIKKMIDETASIFEK